MPLRVHNTLSRQKEEFVPLKGKRVTMFVCGLTPQDYAHLGHAKTYIAFDVIARYLRHKGYAVFYVQNVTDIEDRIIEKMRDSGQDWREIVQHHFADYLRMMELLDVRADLTGLQKIVVFDTKGLHTPEYEVGSKEATRKAYGDALVALGAARGDVVVLDGEVGNSTYTETFGKEIPERFFQMYIAEQQMIGAAIGLQVRGWRPFAATFAAFLTRAFDFVRMAAVSQANVSLCGSHAGVSIGEDGPSQMGLEDLATLRAVHGSTVVYPCDANQTARLLALLADQPGISYMRTTRQATPVMYGPDEEFTIGGSRVLRSSDHDAVTIVAAGITVGEALAAADRLAGEGVGARVIDLYSVKPLDVGTLVEAAEATGHVLTVEDHWPEGGLGEAVFSALAEAGVGVAGELLAVRHMPDSATPEQELAEAGIDAGAIANAAVRLVKQPAAVAGEAGRTR